MQGHLVIVHMLNACKYVNTHMYAHTHTLSNVGAGDPTCLDAEPFNFLFDFGEEAGLGKRNSFGQLSTDSKDLLFFSILISLFLSWFFSPMALRRALIHCCLTSTETAFRCTRWSPRVRQNLQASPSRNSTTWRSEV